MKDVSLLTVLLPTRNRPEMAIRAARSVLAYRDDAVDLVVLDNSDEPLLVPEDLQTDPRFKTVRSDRTLGMADNWERGLDFAKGHYLTYIADKDVLLPDAIETLVNRLRSHEPSIVCYRKGWYNSDRDLVMLYRCSGAFTAYPTAALLDTWFEDPRHLHSAPMVFNSAVSTELVRRIRQRSGRFFIGNSPDVCSGILLSAYQSEYHQLDRMLSVAHGGAWSTGEASKRFGRHHPNIKAFFAELGGNPIDAIGLPATLGSAVVEILLATRSAHPNAFGDRSINWTNYLQRVHRDVAQLEIDASSKREELRVLWSTRCIVPRSVYLVYLMKPYARDVLMRLRLLPLAKALAPSRPPTECREDLKEHTADLHLQQPWDDTGRWVNSPACSIEHAVELAVALNPHL